MINVGADFSFHSSTDRISRTQRTTSCPWRRNIQLQTILIIYERQQRKRISIRSNVTIQLDRHIFTFIQSLCPMSCYHLLNFLSFYSSFKKKGVLGRTNRRWRSRSSYLPEGIQGPFARRRSGIGILPPIPHSQFERE